MAGHAVLELRGVLPRRSLIMIVIQRTPAGIEEAFAIEPVSHS